LCLCFSSLLFDFLSPECPIYEAKRGYVQMLC
jgi:hypothetical protein